MTMLAAASLLTQQKSMESIATEVFTIAALTIPSPVIMNIPCD